MTFKGSALNLADRISTVEPSVVIVSQLVPRGVTATRYLVRHLRARLPELEIVVGRWGRTISESDEENRLLMRDASQIVRSMADLTELILGTAASTKSPSAQRTAPLPV